MVFELLGLCTSDYLHLKLELYFVLLKVETTNSQKQIAVLNLLTILQIVRLTVAVQYTCIPGNVKLNAPS